MEIEKTYDPKLHENAIYNLWESSGLFSPNEDSEGKKYSIMMPPPNATGQLHLGHATMLAIEDVLIRQKRMQGYKALWVPGTDHAAIATQSVVEKKLEKEGITRPRETLGREKLLSEIVTFVENSKSNIKNQTKKMGASCDWSREKYTMDPDMVEAVNTCFQQMYEGGLIYRGYRQVNWDPKMKTTVADDELEYVEEKTPFYYLKYGPFTIATARPETKFGDKIVVVHPDDERYKKYHYQKFSVEWINGVVECQVIPDEAVDPEFGTGVMTITPAHDPHDFEIAMRHQNEIKIEQVIDFDGKMKEIAKELAGLHITKARKAVIEKLSTKGLVEKIDENYTHRVAVNYRGKGVIEPQIMRQWFIDVNKKAVNWKGNLISVKEVMQDVVESKMIKIIPSRFEKTYFHWINNLKDWCISRQIWWGHQIPMWYKLTESQYNDYQSNPNQSSYLLDLLNVEHNGVFGCERPNEEGYWVRDPDTLDTWFSAALWTIAPLGWPKNTHDLKMYHPTDVMETGYDILFFWVARMILSTTYLLRRGGLPEESCIPFKNVYLHGLIRDRDGKKMSKSRPETCIDPLNMIEMYGTDAVRLSLLIGNTPGNDMNLYEEKIAGYRNFVNKIWNSSRFVLMKVENINAKPDATTFTDADKWLIYELNKLIENVDKSFSDFQISNAGSEIYDFLWKTFCDFYLEMSKVSRNDGVLMYGIITLLKLLHPFTPFVTETIYGKLKEAGYKSNSNYLISETWPEKFNYKQDDTACENINFVIQLIRSIREMRLNNKIDPTKKIKAYIYSESHASALEQMKGLIILMTNLSEISFEKPTEEGLYSSMVNKTEIWLEAQSTVEVEKEIVRLKKEIDEIEKFITTLSEKLNSSDFINKAPEKVIEMEKSRLNIALEKKNTLETLARKYTKE